MEGQIKQLNCQINNLANISESLFVKLQKSENQKQLFVEIYSNLCKKVNFKLKKDAQNVNLIKEFYTNEIQICNKLFQ